MEYRLIKNTEIEVKKSKNHFGIDCQLFDTILDVFQNFFNIFYKIPFGFQLVKGSTGNAKSGPFTRSNDYGIDT